MDKKDEKDPKQPPAPVKTDEEVLAEEQLARISGGVLDGIDASKRDSPRRGT